MLTTTLQSPEARIIHSWVDYHYRYNRVAIALVLNDFAQQIERAWLRYMKPDSSTSGSIDVVDATRYYKIVLSLYLVLPINWSIPPSSTLTYKAKHKATKILRDKILLGIVPTITLIPQSTGGLLVCINLPKKEEIFINPDGNLEENALIFDTVPS